MHLINTGCIGVDLIFDRKLPVGGQFLRQIGLGVKFTSDRQVDQVLRQRDLDRKSVV